MRPSQTFGARAPKRIPGYRAASAPRIL
jgi:hypothetical protein